MDRLREAFDRDPVLTALDRKGEIYQALSAFVDVFDHATAPILPPTPQELVTLIASDPTLAKAWETVFEAPADQAPVMPEKPSEKATKDEIEAYQSALATQSSWTVKTARAGGLHPDAAFEIADALTKAGVVGVTLQMVTAAKAWEGSK